MCESPLQNENFIVKKNNFSFYETIFMHAYFEEKPTIYLAHPMTPPAKRIFRTSLKSIHGAKI